MSCDCDSEHKVRVQTVNQQCSVWFDSSRTCYKMAAKYADK